MTTDPLLRLAGIRKHYGGVYALQGVDFTVRSGSVHGLVGANGAGKSTLVKIISGAETPDDGTVSLSGASLGTGDTVAALRAGIATVYQDPQLFGELSVAENVFVGRELRRRGRVDWPAQDRRVRELLSALGLAPDLARVRIADLSVAEQQLVSVAKALAHDAKVLILDEPSAILTDREITTLFAVIQRLTDRGVGVIYVSHRLDELAEIADRVTVLRDGSVVADAPMASLTVREIATLMVGHEPSTAPLGETSVGSPLLTVSDLGRAGRFSDVSFSVAGGEVVSLFGLVGSGADAIARAVYGVLPPDTGLVRSGQLAMLPGDRSRQGVFGSKSVEFNISIGSLRGFWLRRRRERSVAESFIERMRIRTPGPGALVGTLSGGNQQKVVLARQLVDRPEVLLLAEPTQGVDVGAKEEIHGLVREVVAAGTAVLLVSSDLSEVMALADRILVVRGGRITASFGRGAAQADVLAAAAGDR
ncbi:sugar ABC transporter ATP-binding protein [Actinocrispum wychmicini]|uniref:Rhamnose transport system ATP-binding protein n=1 Tax=Actinocrispum wychmicini TaxID=1213861 RepID=A0A4R2JRD1_9PSEU|nr:sugar ABC transporter ATP-binding protein [Actinocrispum wychmicini]TCO56735.1 rhamnose transport system ATP-binding protein [Actinocrispum wychmicini]